MKILAEREIERMFSRPDDRVTRRVSVHQDAWRERIHVKPVVRPLMWHAELLSRHQQRPLIDAVVVLRVRAFQDVERAPTGQSHQSLERPTGPEYSRSPLPILADRNIPYEARHE